MTENASATYPRGSSSSTTIATATTKIGRSKRTNINNLNTSFDMTLLEKEQQQHQQEQSSSEDISPVATTATTLLHTATSWDEHDMITSSSLLLTTTKKRSCRISNGSIGNNSSSCSTTAISTATPTNQQQQERLQSYQQIKMIYPNNNVSNKLPATPSSISRRKHLSSSSTSTNQQHLQKHPPQRVSSSPLQLHSSSQYNHHHQQQSLLTPRSSTLDVVLDPTGRGSSSTTREITTTQQQQQQRTMPRLPPLCDSSSTIQDENEESTTTTTTTTNIPLLMKHQQQYHLLQQTQSKTRRKSKRSFGTCTTVASSSGIFDRYNNANNTINNNNNNNSSSMDDGSNSISGTGNGGNTAICCDSQSVDTNDTVTKNFRFTSFPASLPRIHNSSNNNNNNNNNNIGLPQTIRKHMTFGSEYSHHNHRRTNSFSNNHNNNNNTNNDSHNTSLSSWCNNEDKHQHLGYSDDDDDDDVHVNHTLDDDDEAGTTGTTTILHSSSSSFHQQTPRIRLHFTDDETDNNNNDNIMLSYDPIEDDDHFVMDHYVAISNNAVATPAAAATSTPSRLPIPMFGATATNTVLHKQKRHQINTTATQDEQYCSPRIDNDTMQLQFQLDAVAAQCSPIPGIPEEENCMLDDDEDSTSIMIDDHHSQRSSNHNSNTNHKNDNRTTTSTNNSSSTTSSRRRMNNDHNNNSSTVFPRSLRRTTKTTTTATINSSATSGGESTTGSSQRTSTRPMPDMNAFEDITPVYNHQNIYDHTSTLHQEDTSSRLSSSSISSSTSAEDRNIATTTKKAATGGQQSLSPKLLCPPTPVRIHPIFRNNSNNNSYVDQTDHQDDDNHNQPYEELSSPIYNPRHHQKFVRSNSLIATKIIATCSPQLLQANTDVNCIGSVTDNIIPPNNGEAVTSHCSHQSSQSAHYCSSATHTVTAHAKLNDKVPPIQPPPEQRITDNTISFSSNFDVVSTLGSGAFADVYKVISKTDGRPYAIKRNRRQFRSKRDREVLLSEVRCMQRLQSHMKPKDNSDNDNCTVTKNYSIYLLFFYQAWQEDGHIFCQTELCCRDTCREMIDTIQSWDPSVACTKFPSVNKSLNQLFDLLSSSSSMSIGRLVPETVIWKICHDICAGLSYIHSKVGLVHNDIKPSNILFVKHPRYGAICKIGDFGMARSIGSTEDGQEGDQKYMAQEMLEYGASCPSADMFSLGLTLYEMASHIHISIPPDGHRWHELRSGNININDFPPNRNMDLIHLIRIMMDPNPSCRPSADNILSLTQVSESGNTSNAFLNDYITDVEVYDKQVEEMMMHGSGQGFYMNHTSSTGNMNNSNNNLNGQQQLVPISLDEQTPRNALIRPLVCSPPIHKLPPLPFGGEIALSSPPPPLLQSTEASATGK